MGDESSATHHAQHLLTQLAPGSRETGVGPLCARANKFSPQDLYDIRAPLAVAEALAQRVHGLEYIEIGSGLGDIFTCVACYARRASAFERDGGYCAGLRARTADSKCKALEQPVDVRCPRSFPIGTDTIQQRHRVFRGLHDADVYYAWMEPQDDWLLLSALRAGVRAGAIRSSARLFSLALPLSYYADTRDDPRYIWMEVHKAELASRVTRLPFIEHSYIASAQRKRDRQSLRLINSSVYLLEYNLSSSEWDGVNLTQQLGSRKFYTSQRCPTPKRFVGSTLVRH